MSKEQINRDLRNNFRARISQVAMDYSDLAEAAGIDQNTILATIVSGLISTVIHLLSSMTNITSKEFGDTCAFQFERRVQRTRAGHHAK